MPILPEPFEVELDSLMDQRQNLFARLTRGDAPGKIGNVSPKGSGALLDYDQIAHFGHSILFRPACLSALFKVPGGTSTRLPRHHHGPEFVTMMRLPMAPLHANLKPTIGFEQGNQFPDFHAGILARSRARGLNNNGEPKRRRMRCQSPECPMPGAGKLLQKEGLRRSWTSDWRFVRARATRIGRNRVSLATPTRRHAIVAVEAVLFD